MIPVITGTGFVSSLGGDITTAFAAYCRGESALHPLRSFDRSRYRVTSAYEIADRTDGAPDVPGRASRWLTEAIRQALGQADLGQARRSGGLRVPVIAGTGLAEQRSLELWHTGGAAVTLDGLHFGGAAAALGLPHTMTIVNACSAGLFALAVAADLLALDEADAVIVAASDTITESMFGLLDRVNLQSPSEVRPFDADRQGVILGEGAAAIVLESEAAARGRGVAPLAALRGVAATCDAYHVTAPLREGLGRAFHEAHQRSGVDPGQIDMIMAHGTGTQLNDVTEAAALRDVFGPAVGHPLITALKSMIGHTSGASGLMNLVVAVHAMGAGQVPPTLNHDTPIEEVEGFRIVTGQPGKADIQTCQVEAFGFGGVDAVAILERPPATGSFPAVTPRRPAVGRRTVAITGIGLEAPGIASIDDLMALASRQVSRAWSAAPPDFDGRPVLGRFGLRYKDRATRLALCAVAHALASSGLAAPAAGSAESESFGVIVSSMLAIAGTVCRVVGSIHDGGVTATSPMDLPNVSGNVASSSIAIWFKLAGHNLTVSAGPTSGVDAIYLGANAIRAGRADRIVVVGVEPAEEVAFGLINASAGRHDLSGAQPGVFDGACAVVLEALPSARGRGARPLALIEEYAHSLSLDESVAAVTAPHPRRRPQAGTGNQDGAARLCLLPCLRHPAAADAAPRLGTAEQTGPVDLSATTGEASGALGVLQAAVAARWLRERPEQRALISSGGCWGGSYSSLGLRSPA